MKDRSHSMARPSASRLWTFAKVALALLLVGIVFLRTDLGRLVALRERISWSWLAASLVLFFLLTAVKTLQYHVFFKEEISYPQMLHVVILQNAVTNFIATGAGIASFLALLKAERGVRWSHSSLAFLLTKLGDFFALWCFLGLSLWWVEPRIGPLRGAAVGLMLFMGMGLVALSIAIVWRGKFIVLARSGLERIHLNRLELIQRGLGALEDALSRDTLVGVGVLGKVMLISPVYLALTMLWTYASLRAFGVQIGMSVVVFVNVFVQLLSNLPIHVFGSLGITEATSLYLYGLFYPDQGGLAAALIGFRLWFYLMNLLVLGYLPIEAALGRR